MIFPYIDESVGLPSYDCKTISNSTKFGESVGLNQFWAYSNIIPNFLNFFRCRQRLL